MGLFSSGSDKRAAHVAAQAAAAAREEVKLGAEKAVEYYDPYNQAGQAAIGQQQGVLNDVSSRISGLDPQIAALKGQQAALAPQSAEMYTLAQQHDPILAQIQSGDMNAYQQTPGYDFRMQQGQQALEQSAAAKGQLFSGQTGKALQEYGQDYGPQEYDNYLNRLYNQMGAVNTQMGGRATALNAGQAQVNAGVNQLGMDYNQIAQQMGVSDQYQNLINNGLTAADAAAKLGMNAVMKQAGYTSDIGEIYAGGMQAKSNQLLKMGEGVASLVGGEQLAKPFAQPGSASGGGSAGSQMGGTAGGALGTMIGGPAGGMIGSQLGSAIGGKISGSDAQSEARQQSQSGYYQPKMQAPALQSKYGYF